MFQEISDNGRSSSNKDDTYLKCIRRIQIYRYNENTLALIFYNLQSAKDINEALQKKGITLKLLNQGDAESTYLFSEKDLSIVASIVKPQVKGKNLQPDSSETRRVLKRDYERVNNSPLRI